jgi:hypothetical protein
MKAELQNILIEKYSKMFGYLLEPNEGPIIPIQFGFECGDGWYMLLDELMSEIQNHIENIEKQDHKEIKSWFWRHIMKSIDKRIFYKQKKTRKFFNWIKTFFKHEKEPVPYIKLTQIKEKFGGLRFYYNGGDDTIDGMVRLAESLSYQICEYCGTTINIGQTKGWIVTCCKSCFDSGASNMKTWDPHKE